MSDRPAGGDDAFASCVRSVPKAKAVIRTVGSESAIRICSSHAGGSAVSACSTRIASAVERRTPAATAGPRPPVDVVVIICTAGQAAAQSDASAIVLSLHPASTTTSCTRVSEVAPRCNVSRHFTMLRASLKAGTTTDIDCRGAREVDGDRALRAL